MEKQKIKSVKGITLIALVVTIVVLLILAGVSINALFGNNGIIEKAKQAQSAMDKAKENDLEEIDKLSNWLENATKVEEKKLDMSKYVGHSVKVEGTNLLVLSVDANDPTIATVTTTDSIGKSKINTQGSYGYTTDTASFLYKNSTYETFINTWVESSALKNYMVKSTISIQNYDTFGKSTDVETYAYPQTKESISALFTPCADVYYGNYDSNNIMYILNSAVHLCSGDDVYEADDIAIFFTDSRDKQSKGYYIGNTHQYNSITESPTHPVFRITNITASKITDNGTYQKTSPYSPS